MLILKQKKQSAYSSPGEVVGSQVLTVPVPMAPMPLSAVLKDNFRGIFVSFDSPTNMPESDNCTALIMVGGGGSNTFSNVICMIIVLY